MNERRPAPTMFPRKRKPPERRLDRKEELRMIEEFLAKNPRERRVPAPLPEDHDADTDDGGDL